MTTADDRSDLVARVAAGRHSALVAIRERLASAIATARPRDLAALARAYREVLARLDEMPTQHETADEKIRRLIERSAARNDEIERGRTRPRHDGWDAADPFGFGESKGD